MAAHERVLAINPGNMTTKIAVYEGDDRVLDAGVEHTREELARFDSIPAQLEYRRAAIERTLADKGQLAKPFDAIVGRGGLFRAIPSGTYLVNEAMLEDARTGYAGQHASNLGALLADALVKTLGGRAFVVDPVCVDEFEPLARYSGHADIRATAKKAARKLGKPLDESNLIVAHLGSGISIAPLRRGRMVDVNNALSGGPFSPERTGGLPLIEMLDFMAAKGLDTKGMKKIISKEGGLFSYLGTNDFKDVTKRVGAGDAKAREVVEAMAYQISKEIGGAATVLSGKVDAIVLTGALAHSSLLVGLVCDRVSFIADVVVLPGENELESLASGALEVLRGEEKPRTYPRG
jgi:butyrate kinase